MSDIASGFPDQNHLNWAAFKAEQASGAHAFAGHTTAEGDVVPFDETVRPMPLSDSDIEPGTVAQSGMAKTLADLHDRRVEDPYGAIEDE